MADKISMSQRALAEVMSQRYLKSAIYPSQCNVEKTTEIGLHFMTGAGLRLGPGNQLAKFEKNLSVGSISVERP